MKKLILCFMVLIFSSAAQADILEEESFACISESLLNQLTDSAINQDKMSFVYLLDNGCVFTKKDFEATIIERRLMGLVRVRVYLGEEVINLWTYNESIKKGE